MKLNFLIFSLLSFNNESNLFKPLSDKFKKTSFLNLSALFNKLQNFFSTSINLSASFSNVSSLEDKLKKS